MKKLLGLLAATGLVATTSATVVACGEKQETSTTSVTLKDGSLEANIKLVNAEMLDGGTITVTGNVGNLNVDLNNKTVKDGKFLTTISIEQANLPKLEDINEVLTFTYVAPIEGGATKSETITFEVNVKVIAKKDQLSTVITTTDLGELEDNSQETITEAINAKNVNASGKYELSNITQKGAIATGIGTFEGKVNLSFTVQSEENKTYDISLDKTSVNLDLNGNVSSTIKIENFSELKDVKVESNNATIASVNHANGTITVNAKAEGTANITVSASNGKSTQTISITVADTRTYDISLDKNSVNLDLNGNVSSTIKIENFSELKDVKVESNNATIASVNHANGTITVNAKAEGTANIIVSASNGKSTQTISITVADTRTYDISLDKTSVNLDLNGNVSSTIKIENFSELKDVKVESKNAAIVSVNHANGTITVNAKAEGTANITVSASNGKSTQTISITVADTRTYDISLDKTSVNLDLNGNVSSTIKIENFSELKDVKVESKNAAIVSVNHANGTITVNAKAEGTANITVSASNGKSVAEVSVTIVDTTPTEPEETL
ncbi:Ig-like domain-containing protein [Spiroplasma monobiae]|uniref:BIG2 domain-containing protein n=1 Tax=Spiroplasma monobiae MQ-1 TaxID=1336748 RepID=A0A2K9LUC5_SPISQ|nr:Ig-like domain-containing protein [Spiroplasma monobiae]AUM62659.1 hypothetical protein SMONO_v1c04100 [Spiroplasma monobiae MQ-1]